MTVTINDSFTDQVIAFLKTLPKEAVKIEEVATPWYADEVQKRIEEYQSGNMKMASLDQAFWDEMDDFIDTVA
jgi:sensor domain CHASE-containing protein